MVLLVLFGIVTRNELAWMLLVIMTVNSGRDDCAASDFGPPVSSGMLATWMGAGDGAWL